MRNLLWLATSAFLTIPWTADGQTTPNWYVWHNKVAPVLSTTVALDTVTGDFVYAYAIANQSGAEQSINSFFLELPLEAPSVGSPINWDASFQGGPHVSWFADGAVDPTWTEVYETDLPSFLSEIRPGQALAGFSVRTPCASSGTLTYYITGYARDGHQPPDDTTSWVQVPQWGDDAVKGTVIGPGNCNTVADWGNRRPGVDGFLGLVNFASGSALPRGPVTVQVRFSRAGEQVDRATFQAALNGKNVTASFRMNSRGDMAAVFPLVPPLKIGRNTLLLSVDGVISGTRTATDADRFVFEVQ